MWTVLDCIFVLHRTIWRLFPDWYIFSMLIKLQTFVRRGCYRLIIENWMHPNWTISIWIISIITNRIRISWCFEAFDSGSQEVAFKVLEGEAGQGSLPAICKRPFWSQIWDCLGRGKHMLSCTCRWWSDARRMDARNFQLVPCSHSSDLEHKIYFVKEDAVICPLGDVGVSFRS